MKKIGYLLSILTVSSLLAVDYILVFKTEAVYSIFELMVICVLNVLGFLAAFLYFDFARQEY